MKIVEVSGNLSEKLPEMQSVENLHLFAKKISKCLVVSKKVRTFALQFE